MSMNVQVGTLLGQFLTPWGGEKVACKHVSIYFSIRLQKQILEKRNPSMALLEEDDQDTFIHQTCSVIFLVKA